MRVLSKDSCRELASSTRVGTKAMMLLTEPPLLKLASQEAAGNSRALLGLCHIDVHTDHTCNKLSMELDERYVFAFNDITFVKNRVES